MSLFVILWLIAGFIIGWILIEVIAVITDSVMPWAFNFGLGFVGALTAYTILH